MGCARASAKIPSTYTITDYFIQNYPYTHRIWSVCVFLNICTCDFVWLLVNLKYIILQINILNDFEMNNELSSKNIPSYNVIMFETCNLKVKIRMILQGSVTINNHMNYIFTFVARVTTKYDN